MMQQLLAGVSTREYEGSLEARPCGRCTRGSSKSAVSRVVVRRTRQRMQEQLTRRLEGLEVMALFTVSMLEGAGGRGTIGYSNDVRRRPPR